MTGAALSRLLLKVLKLLMLLWPLAGFAGEPPATAFLRIEAGGHTSAVPRLALDATGHLMASAGYDKTIRLWSLPDGTARASTVLGTATAPHQRRIVSAGRGTGRPRRPARPGRPGTVLDRAGQQGR